MYFFFIGVISIGKSFILLDGYDVWDMILFGKFFLCIEILYNIDLVGIVLLVFDILGGYIGIVFRVGEMKLLMNVFNDMWYKLFEFGGKLEREVFLDVEFEFLDVVRCVFFIVLLI